MDSAILRGFEHYYDAQTAALWGSGPMWDILFIKHFAECSISAQAPVALSVEIANDARFTRGDVAFNRQTLPLSAHMEFYTQEYLDIFRIIERTMRSVAFQSNELASPRGPISALARSIREKVPLAYHQNNLSALENACAVIFSQIGDISDQWFGFERRLDFLRQALQVKKLNLERMDKREEETKIALSKLKGQIADKVQCIDQALDGLDVKASLITKANWSNEFTVQHVYREFDKRENLVTEAISEARWKIASLALDAKELEAEQAEKQQAFNKAKKKRDEAERAYQFHQKEVDLIKLKAVENNQKSYTTQLYELCYLASVSEADKRRKLDGDVQLEVLENDARKYRAEFERVNRKAAWCESELKRVLELRSAAVREQQHNLRINRERNDDLRDIQARKASFFPLTEGWKMLKAEQIRLETEMQQPKADDGLGKETLLNVVMEFYQRFELFWHSCRIITSRLQGLKEAISSTGDVGQRLNRLVASVEAFHSSAVNLTAPEREHLVLEPVARAVELALTFSIVEDISTFYRDACVNQYQAGLHQVFALKADGIQMVSAAQKPVQGLPGYSPIQYSRINTAVGGSRPKGSEVQKWIDAEVKTSGTLSRSAVATTPTTMSSNPTDFATYRRGCFQAIEQATVPAARFLTASYDTARSTTLDTRSAKIKQTLEFILGRSVKFSSKADNDANSAEKAVSKTKAIWKNIKQSRRSNKQGENDTIDGNDRDGDRNRAMSSTSTLSLSTLSPTMSILSITSSSMSSPPSERAFPMFNAQEIGGKEVARASELGNRRSARW